MWDKRHARLRSYTGSRMTGARMERFLTTGVLVVFATLLVLFAAFPARSQTARANAPQAVVFEAASVKPNTSAAPASSIGFEPGGRFRAVNMSVSRLVQEAFATATTPRPTIVGAPRWVESDRFDVEAIAAESPSQEQGQAMLRAMLTERFGLVARRETRVLPVYHLVQVPGEVKQRDRLRVSDGACEEVRRAGPSAPTLEQRAACTLAFARGSLRVNGVTASEFATAGLTRTVDRPVIDRTGLGATLYDWAIEWAPDPAAATTDLPSTVFSAVQEQLGLKLEPATGSVDVVVIGRVEKPTPD
jgi:uncharacterized protein (TIGR03435 family)